jgi:hypothetical protein
MEVTSCGQNVKTLPMTAPKYAMHVPRVRHVMGAAGTKRFFAIPCKHIRSRIVTALISFILFDSAISTPPNAI